MARNKFLTQVRVAERRRNLKKQAIAYLGGKCEKCGYNKCAAAMHFHHTDPTQKDFGIASNGNTRSWEAIKTELDKCILLCSNCHAEEHDKEWENRHNLNLEKASEIKSSTYPKSIKVKCFNCGCSLITYQSRLNRSKNVFCGVGCKNEYFRSFKWPSDEQLIKMFYKMSVDDICINIGLSKSSVYKKLKSLDLVSNNKRGRKPATSNKTCETCGNICNNKYCSHKCSAKGSEKIEWPSDEKLKDLICSMSMVKVGKLLGVSDNAVKKRCVSRNIKK